ncbi:MAG: hypothetical protein ABSC60_13070 [Acidobacteriota bacterium]|jgi:hypothetical protein
MKTNPWQKDFSKAAKYALNVKPPLGVWGTIALALIFCELGRFLGVIDRSDWPFVIIGTLLCVLLSYVLSVNAKLDMLKRTLDQKARYRATKELWLESIEENESDEQTVR